MESDFVD